MLSTILISGVQKESRKIVYYFILLNDRTSFYVDDNTVKLVLNDEEYTLKSLN